MTPTECIVRQRRDADLKDLADALVRVHAQDGYPVEGVANPLAWLEHPLALRSWVAVVDSVPIGQVTLTKPDSGDDAARLWVEETGGSPAALAIVVRLFVDPEHRSVGAGRLLMIAALDYASQIGRSVSLDVMAKDRAAIRLYERLGARRLGAVTHYHGADLAESALVYAFPTAPGI